MSENQAGSGQKITVDQWLADIGFSRGNPFAKTAADEERDQLQEELFVPIAPYYEAAGDEMRLIFAPRGGGKSAIRVRLASQGLPQMADANALVVEVTDWGWLASRYREDGFIVADDYAKSLLSLAAKALWDAFFPIATLQSDSQVKKDRKHREERAAQISQPRCAAIAAIMRRRAKDELKANALHNKLLLLSSSFEVDWSQFQEAVAAKRLGSLLAETSLKDDPIANLLASVVDAVVDESPSDAASLLSQFTPLMEAATAAGIGRVHFLLDRLDENHLLTDSIEKQAAVLEPLLHELELHDLVVFKYFLSRELKGALSIRWDRYSGKVVEIQWDEELLREVLNGRLAYFSDGAYQSLVALCQQDGEDIQDQMLRMALGSPRRMLTAGQLLCEARAKSKNPDGLFTMTDWKEAKAALLQVLPPTLKLLLDQGKAVVAGEERKLSKIETQILRFLVDAGGECGREDLVSEVWGAMTDQAVDKAFSRLRSKLDDDGKTPVYLQTLKGSPRGFRLNHYETSE